MQNGKFRLMEGAGRVLLYQEYGRNRPNVAHFYGEEAEENAKDCLERGDLGFMPTHAEVDGHQMTVREFVAK